MLVASGDSFVEVGGVAGVFEKETHKAVFRFKRVEKLPVLRVLEVHVELLVPQNTLGPYDVHELEEKSVAHEIIHEGYCA